MQPAKRFKATYFTLLIAAVAIVLFDGARFGKAEPEQATIVSKRVEGSGKGVRHWCTAHVAGPTGASVVFRCSSNDGMDYGAGRTVSVRRLGPPGPAETVVDRWTHAFVITGWAIWVLAALAGVAMVLDLRERKNRKPPK